MPLNDVRGAAPGSRPIQQIAYGGDESEPPGELQRSSSSRADFPLEPQLRAALGEAAAKHFVIPESSGTPTRARLFVDVRRNSRPEIIGEKRRHNNSRKKLLPRRDRDHG